MPKDTCVKHSFRDSGFLSSSRKKTSSSLIERPSLVWENIPSVKVLLITQKFKKKREIRTHIYKKKILRIQLLPLINFFVRRTVIFLVCMLKSHNFHYPTINQNFYTKNGINCVRCQPFIIVRDCFIINGNNCRNNKRQLNQLSA